MKDEIRSTVNKLENIKENFEDHFQTKFGKEFTENCKELEDYVKSGYVVPIITKLYKIIRNFLGSEDIISTINTMIEETTTFEPEQKRLAHMGLNDLHIEVKQDDGSFDKFENQISDLRIINRMTEYYILKLYAYLEIYSISLFQHIISNIETDIIFDVLSKIPRTSNPISMIEALLKSFIIEEKRDLKYKQRNKTLYSELIEQITKTAWEYDFYYVEEFIKFRNIIAHRKKLASHDEFEKTFPNQVKSANERLNLEVKNIKKSDEFIKIRNFFVHMGIEEFVLKELHDLFEDMKFLLTIDEIGKSCFRYILLIDNIITKHPALRNIEK
ncbi:MAG: hypothetical protein KAR08_07245 [Candidatus Heimdallarchaeota archaeon]|nr:hypothetical protein [Candidatus Heimdallarchaeota archaeon]